MRQGLTVLAVAALALGGCGSKGEADATANGDSGLTADRIAANDVTAIDAVTGEAANMAADVDYSNFLGNAGDNSAATTAGSKPKTSTMGKAAPKSAPKSAPAPAPDATEPANAL